MTNKFLIGRVLINDPPIKILKSFLAIIFILFITVVLLAISACGNKPQVITETKIIIIKPPAITPCERLTIKGCSPTTNGELYQCGLEAIKKLWLCADQVDALIDWSKNIHEKAKKPD